MNVGKEWDSHSIKNYKTVEQIKKQLRKANWCYLSSHPEIRAIIRVFLHNAINNKPRNIYEFAGLLFNINNLGILTPMINQQLKRVNTQLRKSHWSEYDGDMLFSEKESTHSLLSQSSITDNADCLLRYSLVLKKPDGCP